MKPEIIRYRQMQRWDIPRCVELVAEHPVLGARYGHIIQDLGKAWLEIFEQRTVVAVVCEEIDTSGIPALLGASVSVFVHDDFVRDLKTPPHFWIGPELTRRIVRGASPVLSDKDVREANSTGGLTSVVWQLCVRYDHPQGPERAHQGNSTFFEAMRGFCLNEFIAQVESVEHAKCLISSGGLVFNAANGRYEEFPQPTTLEWVARLHLAGLSRECSRTPLGSWASSAFRYSSPRIGFTEGEQRLLVAALEGGTSEDLAEQLTVSVFAIKRTWRAIYDRVSDRMPELIEETGDVNGGRGKQKKGRLLAYVSQHPEELRPITRQYRIAMAGRTVKSLSA